MQQYTNDLRCLFRDHAEVQHSEIIETLSQSLFQKMTVLHVVLLKSCHNLRFVSEKNCTACHVVPDSVTISVAEDDCTARRVSQDSVKLSSQQVQIPLVASLPRTC